MRLYLFFNKVEYKNEINKIFNTITDWLQNLNLKVNVAKLEASISNYWRKYTKLN